MYTNGCTFYIRRFSAGWAEIKKSCIQRGTGVGPTRHCSQPYNIASDIPVYEQHEEEPGRPGGASNPNNVEIFIRRHGRINSWIAASAAPMRAHSFSFFVLSDLFEIRSDIYLPSGYDVDLLSAEYSRALCAVISLCRHSVISRSTFGCGRAHCGRLSIGDRSSGQLSRTIVCCKILEPSRSITQSCKRYTAMRTPQAYFLCHLT